VSRLWRPRGHAAEILGVERRVFLAAGGAALGGLVLGACNGRPSRTTQRLLDRAESFNERVERALFRHRSMNVAPARAAAAGPAFPSYFISAAVPEWDEAANGPWRLQVGGLVRTPLSLSLDDLRALPRVELRLEHFCVEGWTAVSVRAGVLLSELARRAGVRDDARYVDFQSFDDGYHESWDIDSALHPQTLIVYGQDGRLLDPAYGAPARVYSPVKLGYKCTKYLTRVDFLAERNGGFWSDQGYEWYGGT
jgi:DMSO/TMAO reductase YedYZ molybdopterin-dependent catalytic subunit